MIRHFDPAPFRSSYAEQLQPIFSNYKPFIVLDKRNEFYLRLLSDHRVLAPGKHLVDLGAGRSVFGPICKAYGMKVTLVDDFGGGGGVEHGNPQGGTPLLQVFEKQLGLGIIRQNLLEAPLPLANATVDVVTCFHSLEHRHHSPRRLIKAIVRTLKAGAIFVLATPNAVKLGKRI